MFEWMKSDTEDKKNEKKTVAEKPIKQMSDHELFDAAFNRLVDLDRKDDTDLDELLAYVAEVFQHISIVAMRQFLDPEVEFKRTGSFDLRHMEQFISDCSNLELDVNRPIFNNCPVKLSLYRGAITDDPVIYFQLITTEDYKYKPERVTLFNDPVKNELIEHYDVRVKTRGKLPTASDSNAENGIVIDKFRYTTSRYDGAKISWIVTV